MLAQTLTAAPFDLSKVSDGISNLMLTLTTIAGIVTSLIGFVKWFRAQKMTDLLILMIEKMEPLAIKILVDHGLPTDKALKVADALLNAAKGMIQRQATETGVEDTLHKRVEKVTESQRTIVDEHGEPIPPK